MRFVTKRYSTRAFLFLFHQTSEAVMVGVKGYNPIVLPLVHAVKETQRIGHLIVTSTLLLLTLKGR
jgi:hypothetical protein